MIPGPVGWFAMGATFGLVLCGWPWHPRFSRYSRSIRHQDEHDALTVWLLNGERGLSGNAMVGHITGVGGATNHPLDPDDLRRCRLLVEQVPVIRAFLPRMATCSPVWARIVAHWDELCSLMDAEAPDWRKGRGSAPQTYALLQKLREVQP